MSQREQQTARVNVDDATWQTFRIRAIQADRSVADELARLVRNELRHSPPTEPPKPAAPKPTPTDATDPTKPAATKKATTRDRQRRSKPRLADLDLLTELPYRERPSSRTSDTADDPPRRR